MRSIEDECEVFNGVLPMENELFSPNSVEEYNIEIYRMDNLGDHEKEKYQEMNLSYGIQSDYFERAPDKESFIYE